ncbi:MAG: hypothetical protein ABEH83_14500 [Halobacterium sp.]
MVDVEAITVGDVPVLSGLLNGVLTYVTGFVASVALYSLVGTNALVRVAYSGLSAGAEFGFVFYGAHLVPVTDGTESLNFALDVASSGELFVLVVAVLLASSGYSMGAKDSLPDATTSTLAGASIALGYLPLAVAGGLYFTGTTGETTLSLSLARVVLLAGVLFPVGFGALGGYAASLSD